MTKRLFAALALALALLAPPRARAAEFNRKCSVTGGSAQQLSAVLSACGYTGVVSLAELSLKDPEDAANDLYVGQSDVDSTNGYKIAAGDSKTWRATNPQDIIEASRLYLYVSSTQSVFVSLRSK